MSNRPDLRPSYRNHDEPELADDTLAACLTALIERVDRRTDQAQGTYSEDGLYVRRAAKQVLSLRHQLNLGQLIGPLGPERTKPQFLLLFQRPTGERLVLKVYGKSRPGEAFVQTAWRRHRIRVVDVLDAGDDPASWLVMRPIEAIPVAPGGRIAGSQLSVTAELAAILAPAHAVGTQLLSHDEVPLSKLQRLETAIKHHLLIAVRALERHGYAIRRDWLAPAIRLHASEPVTLLHGDLVVGNVVRDAADGQLLLLDSRGYIGPAEFDAARWAARVGGATESLSALSTWLDVEPNLNARLAHTLLALELLMEAGVRELVKEEQGAPWHARDTTTQELLEAAEANFALQRV